MEDEAKKSRGFKLGDISPLAGLVTGEGLTGNVLGGILPMAIRNQMDRKNRGEEDKAMDEKAMKPTGMKRGGKVGGVMKGGDMPFFASKAKDKMASKAKPARKPMTNYKAGGSVRGDGMATKGKTRGREC